jgi:hypothetical protein
VVSWSDYIGKESDRHWEQGEDLSLLEFTTIQYKRRGNAVADDEQLARIANVPKREFMRRGINQFYRAHGLTFTDFLQRMPLGEHC